MLSSSIAPRELKSSSDDNSTVSENSCRSWCCSGARRGERHGTRASELTVSAAQVLETNASSSTPQRSGLHPIPLCPGTGCCAPLGPLIVPGCYPPRARHVRLCAGPAHARRVRCARRAGRGRRGPYHAPAAWRLRLERPLRPRLRQRGLPAQRAPIAPPCTA